MNFNPEEFVDYVILLRSIAAAAASVLSEEGVKEEILSFSVGVALIGMLEDLEKYR